MYTMLRTWPNIAYTIGALSQYSAKPGTSHLMVVNQLLWYLNVTKDYKLTLDGNSHEDDNTTYSDLDWAGDSTDHHSISSYVFKMAGTTVTWSSKKQSSTALSSTKGEYMALTHATKEAMWIQYFLSDVLFTTSHKLTILGDNQGALALTVNPTHHARTKHICVCEHFIWECVEAGNIDLNYIPTADRVADIFTKGLPVVEHKRFTKDMGLVGVSTHWVGMLEDNGD